MLVCHGGGLGQKAWVICRYPWRGLEEFSVIPPHISLSQYAGERWQLAYVSSPCLLFLKLVRLCCMVQAILQIPLIVMVGGRVEQLQRICTRPSFLWVLLFDLLQSVTPKGFLLSPVGAEN